MSESQEAKRDKALRAQALSYTPGVDGLWDWEALSNAVNYGNGVPVGTKFRAPTSMSDLYQMGIGNGTSPEGGSVGLDEFMRKYGLTLPEYQSRFGGLPLIFNSDGTATYDPSAQKNSFSYTPEKTFMDYIGPLALGSLAGLGLTGYLPGTESVFGAGTSGGLGGLQGSFETGIPVQGGSYALESGLGGLGDFSLAGAGQGIGGVGTAGLGLGSGGSAIGLTPGLATGGGTLLGGGAIGGMADSLAALGGAGSLSSLPATAQLGSLVGSSSIWDTLSKALNLNNTTKPNGISTAASGIGKLLGLSDETSNALGGIGQFGGSLLEYLQSKGISGDLANALSAAADRGDPFSSQRGYYQDQLKQSYSDPNFFNNSPVFKGMRDTIINDVGRTMSAQGYSGSPNTLYEIADRLQKTGMNYATQFQGQLAQNAGAGISPGTSAAIAAQGANTVAQSQKQANGALGATLGNLPNLINGIQGLI